MGLKTRVIVSNVKTLHDARYCAGMGVEMISIPMDKENPQHIKTEEFKEIASWLSGINFVASLNSSSEIDPIVVDALDYIMTDNVALIGDLLAYKLPLIYKLELEEDSTLENLTAECNALPEEVELIVVENNKNLNKDFTPWLSELASQFNIFVGFGINEQNVNSILDSIKPNGIALKGSKEIKVGDHDFDELASVLEAIETDEWA